MARCKETWGDDQGPCHQCEKSAEHLHGIHRCPCGAVKVNDEGVPDGLQVT